MKYIEYLESVNKKMIVKEKGLKITQDAILLSEFIKKYFEANYKSEKKISRSWSRTRNNFSIAF